MSYLLDTDVCSNFLRGREPARSWLLAHRAESVLSRVTVAELSVLLHRSRRTDSRLRRDVARFVTSFPVVEATDVVWELFSSVKADSLNHGTVVGDFDILQACVAHTNGFIVATQNRRHFDALDELLGFGVETQGS